FPFAEGVEVFWNRGTSGIDGCTSIAIGAATTSNKTTTIITGAVSCFYVSNTLWYINIRIHFKIIIVNNGVSSIFRILPGHKENEVFNTYFETEHHLTAQYLASMYKMHYVQASSTDELVKGLNEIYTNNNQPCILEIFTPTK